MLVTLTFTLVFLVQGGTPHTGHVKATQTYESLEKCEMAAKVIQQAPMPGEISDVSCRVHL
jgi:hypothetical protein